MQTTEKRLLYYCWYKRANHNYNGVPVYFFCFKDVKTNEEVVLGNCYYASEISEYLGGQFYYNIMDATNNYDILWQYTNGIIEPLNASFSDVQKEYEQMLNQDISNINEVMLNIFSNSNLKL